MLKGPRLRLLLFGIMLLAMGASFLGVIWTKHSNLKEIKGSVRSVNIYTHTETDRHDRSYQVQDLIFYFYGSPQEYRLTKDIGDQFHDDQYQNILLALKHIDSVSVWVTRNEINDPSPKVFQINYGNIMLLNFNDVINDSRTATEVLLAFGAALIAIASTKSFFE